MNFGILEETMLDLIKIKDNQIKKKKKTEHTITVVFSKRLNIVVLNWNLIDYIIDQVIPSNICIIVYKIYKENWLMLLAEYLLHLIEIFVYYIQHLG